jgi:hypothetical protein
VLPPAVLQQPADCIVRFVELPLHAPNTVLNLTHCLQLMLQLESAPLHQRIVSTVHDSL